MSGYSTNRVENKLSFLRMMQPIDEMNFPHPRIFEAGKFYSFPFLFIVPKALLPSACTHHTSYNHVREAHLSLPPSLGNSEMPAEDFAPSAAEISYSVSVRIIRKPEDEEDMKAVIADEQQRIRIVPASEEQPPMSIGMRDEDYCLRKLKLIRKRLFRGRVGHIAIEAVQPKSLQVPAFIPDRHRDATTQTTAVSLHLRFDPASPKSSPPELVSLVSKLKVSTYFASSPRSSLPSLSTALSDRSQDLSSFTQLLSSRSVASAQWERHEPGSDSVEPDSRRGSAVSMASETPNPSPSYSERNPFFTTTVVVPISLLSGQDEQEARNDDNDKKKIFLPTFHSCLISRTYTLILSVTLESFGMAHIIPMRIPLQIVAKGTKTNIQKNNRDAHLDFDGDFDAIGQFLQGTQVDATLPSDHTTPQRDVPSAPGSRSHSWSGFMTSEMRPPGYEAAAASLEHSRTTGVSVCG